VGLNPVKDSCAFLEQEGFTFIAECRVLVQVPGSDSRVIYAMYK